MHAGWDWASETHDVTSLSNDGEAVVDRWQLVHDADGIDAAIARLARHGRPEELPVAIETTSGLVVDRLLRSVPAFPLAGRRHWPATRFLGFAVMTPRVAHATVAVMESVARLAAFVPRHDSRVIAGGSGA